MEQRRDFLYDYQNRPVENSGLSTCLAKNIGVEEILRETIKCSTTKTSMVDASTMAIGASDGTLIRTITCTVSRNKTFADSTAVWKRPRADLDAQCQNTSSTMPFEAKMVA